MRADVNQPHMHYTIEYAHGAAPGRKHHRTTRARGNRAHNAHRAGPTVGTIAQRGRLGRDDTHDWTHECVRVCQAKVDTP